MSLSQPLFLRSILPNLTSVLPHFFSYSNQFAPIRHLPSCRGNKLNERRLLQFLLHTFQRITLRAPPIGHSQLIGKIYFEHKKHCIPYRKIGRGDRYSPDGPSRLQTNSIICAHNFHFGSSVFIEQEIYMQNTHKIVSLFSLFLLLLRLLFTSFLTLCSLFMNTKWLQNN